LFEEEKQIIYAKKMGLKLVGNEKTPYEFNLDGVSILDIGGGPISLLLKCTNFGRAVVADPINYPAWVQDRYQSAGIGFWNIKGEDIRSDSEFDEVWIYNVLQHVEDPQTVVMNAKRAGKLIRIFEWLNTPISNGHLHSLQEDLLDTWLGGDGKVETLKNRPTIGTAYYGIFI